MHENFEYFLKSYSPVFPTEKPGDSQIERLEKILPGSLMEFIRRYGLVAFHGGLFQLCDPDEFRSVLALIFGADSDFHHKDCHVVGYSAFGVLQCWSDKYFKFEIELPLGVAYCRALTLPGWKLAAYADHIASAVVPDREEADFLDVDGIPMFDRCVEKYGPLRQGECFGFVPALAISGAFGPMQRVDNIQRMPALEHFSILAQLEQFQLATLTPTEVVPVRPIG
ncbi:GAD-like domain-containing protein [Sinorhizobium fredii]|uniref:GAD-like domain-containing protein n=1 Tax=Rhizobium fredii TaxID=380 RepID=UPI003511E139